MIPFRGDGVLALQFDAEGNRSDVVDVSILSGEWALKAERSLSHQAYVAEIALDYGRLTPWQESIQLEFDQEITVVGIPLAVCTVVDANTAAELDGIDCFFHPDEAEAEQVPAWLRVEGPATVPQGGLMRRVAQAVASPVVLGHQKQDGRFWFRAPGYAWSTFRWHGAMDASPTIELEPAATLSVTVEADASDGIFVGVYQRTPIPSEVPVARMGAEVATGIALAPRRYLVRAERGRDWKVAQILAEEEIELQAEEANELTLAVADRAETSGRLAGELKFDGVRTSCDAVKIKVTALSQNAMRQSRQPQVAELALDSGRCMWEVPDDILKGAYLVMVEPFGYSEIVLVDDHPVYKAIRIPPRALRFVNVVDGSSGEPVDVREFRYGRNAEMDEGATLSRDVLWQAHFDNTRVILQPDSPIRLDLINGRYRVAVGAMGFGETEFELDLGRDDTDVYLSVHQQSEIILRATRALDEIGLDPAWVAQVRVVDPTGAAILPTVEPRVNLRFGDEIEYHSGLSFDYSGPCVVRVPAKSGFCRAQSFELDVEAGQQYELPISRIE